MVYFHKNNEVVGDFALEQQITEQITEEWEKQEVQKHALRRAILGLDNQDFKTSPTKKLDFISVPNNPRNLPFQINNSNKKAKKSNHSKSRPVILPIQSHPANSFGNILPKNPPSLIPHENVFHSPVSLPSKKEIKRLNQTKTVTKSWKS